MSDLSYSYDTIPLSDEEVALLQPVLKQFAPDSGRVIERFVVQVNNPRIGEDDRCIYLVSTADIEAIKTALQAAIADTSEPARKRRLAALLKWVYWQTDDISAA